MNAAKTTREQCDDICRSSNATEFEKTLAMRYRELHSSARTAYFVLKAYTKNAPEDRVASEVIGELAAPRGGSGGGAGGNLGYCPLDLEGSFFAGSGGGGGGGVLVLQVRGRLTVTATGRAASTR